MKKWKDFFNTFGTLEDFAVISGFSAPTIWRWSMQNRVPANKHNQMIDLAKGNAVKLNHAIIKKMEKK